MKNARVVGHHEKLRRPQVQRRVEAAAGAERALVEVEECVAPAVERGQAIERAADVGEHRCSAVCDPAIELEVEAHVGEESMCTDMELESAGGDGRHRLAVRRPTRIAARGAFLAWSDWASTRCDFTTLARVAEILSVRVPKAVDGVRRRS